MENISQAEYLSADNSNNIPFANIVAPFDNSSQPNRREISSSFTKGGTPQISATNHDLGHMSQQSNTWINEPDNSTNMNRGIQEAVPLSADVVDISISPVVEVGSSCKAYYKDKYYDAFITAIDPENNKVKVKFKNFSYFPTLPMDKIIIT